MNVESEIIQQVDPHIRMMDCIIRIYQGGTKLRQIGQTGPDVLVRRVGMYKSFGCVLDELLACPCGPFFSQIVNKAFPECLGAGREEVEEIINSERLIINC